MPSSARTSAPLAGGGAGIPLGMNRVSCGADVLDLDHAPLVLARDRHERGGPARDHGPVGEPAQRLALVGPGVLVGDDHGHAGEAADDRAPQVRAELVGVQHVHALPAQEPVQRPPRPDLARGGALQADHPHVGGAQVRERVCDVLLRDRDVEVTARDQRAVEALRVEPGGGLDREPLGAARPEPVDKRHDPQLAVVAAGGGHAANIMPERPAADVLLETSSGFATASACDRHGGRHSIYDPTAEPHRRSSGRRRPRPARAQLPGLLLEREELRAAGRHTGSAPRGCAATTSTCG